MRWVAMLWLAALPALAQERKLAVLPISGVLERADASALEEAVRQKARELDVTLVEGASESVSAAVDLGATHAVTGKAARMEGALAVTLMVVRAGDGSRLAMERLVGFTMSDLQGEARKKLERLLRAGLGMAPAAAATPPVPSPAPTPSSTPTPNATPTPAPSATPIPSATPRATPRAPSTPTSTPTPTSVPTPPPAAPRAAAPASPSPQPQVTGAAADSPLVAIIRRVIEEVEQVRGLKRRATLKVAILSDDLFSQALRAKAERELTPAAVALERARWIAFGLAPPSADPRKILLGVLDEQVAGFYDPSTKALTVREKVPASAGAMGPDGFQLVLAHEIEHALQDQNFGFPDMDKLPDDDARLARMALYEGDAMATMTAVAARRAQRPVKLALGAAATAMRSLTAAQIVQASGYSPELLQAPAVVREELATPYVAGMALVAEVHRRGGFALVDKMFRKPPQTTHQVLHPEAYLAGELPTRVPFPPGPPGLQAIGSGRMGELGMRLALSVCVDEQVARDFAARWAGDAYTLVRGPLDSIGLVWSTAWAGDGARTFANLIGMQAPCWQEAAQLPHEGSFTISAAAEVRVDGAKAALARGLSQAVLGPAAAGAAEFDPRVPAAVPPLGELPADPASARARITDGRFVSARLGIEAEVPPGFDPDLDVPAAELVLRKPRPAALATLMFVPETVNAEVVEGFFQTAAASFASELGGSSLKLRGAQRTTLLGSSAQERAWEMDGTQALLRITLAPACGGKGYYAVLRASADDASRSALEKFVGSLHATGPVSPACAELQ